EQVLTALAFVDPAASPVSGEGTAAAGAAVFGDANRGSDTGSAGGGTAGTGTGGMPADRADEATGPVPAVDSVRSGLDGTAVAEEADDDATLVNGGDAVDDKKDLEYGKNELPGSGRSREKVRAWLTGHSVDPYKTALLDPDRRFPQAVTANPLHLPVHLEWFEPVWLDGSDNARVLTAPASGGRDVSPPAFFDRDDSPAGAAVEALFRNWLSPSSSRYYVGRPSVIEAYRDGGEAAAAIVVWQQTARRNADLFGRFRRAQAAAIGGSVGELLEVGRQLARRGVEVFRLEWSALPAPEQADVTAWVMRSVGPENIGGWDTRDLGAVAVARRSGQEAAANVVKHVLAERARLRSQPSGSRRGPIVGMALVDDQAQKRQVLEELRDGFE
ncbi:hypothetical protein PV350_46515, partial [Streptomyces sp. PA03-6a]|nr:hypothetical protein [Streptomyces sp. PA03-6a]